LAHQWASAPVSSIALVRPTSQMGFKIDEIVHPDSRGIAQQFECCICMCVVNEPLQTVCDHIFCAECLSSSLACPTCRTALGVGDRKPLRDCNRPLMRMIHNLQVWCPYHAESKFVPPDETESVEIVDSVEDVEEPAAKRARVGTCTWSGSYGDLLALHVVVCEHHFVPCPHGCGLQVRRSELAAHAPSCKMNFETCTICREAVKAGEMPQYRRDKAELHVQLLEARLAERDDSTDLKLTLDGIHDRLKTLESPAIASSSTWEWTIHDMAAKLLHFSKGQHITSPEFRLCGHGPFKVHFYPRGDRESNVQRGAVSLEGPSDLKVQARISIGDWSYQFRGPRNMGAGHGSRNAVVPDATGSLTIVVDFQKVVLCSDTD